MIDKELAAAWANVKAQWAVVWADAVQHPTAYGTVAMCLVVLALLMSWL